MQKEMLVYYITTLQWSSTVLQHFTSNNNSKQKWPKMAKKILPYLLYHSRVYTRRRTPDGADFHYTRVYTRGAHEMELDFTLENPLHLVCAYACIHAWRTLSNKSFLHSIWCAPTRVYTRRAVFWPFL